MRLFVKGATRPNAANLRINICAQTQDGIKKNMVKLSKKGAMLLSVHLKKQLVNDCSWEGGI